VIHGNDSPAVQKHVVATCFVRASTVPIGNCQNTAAVGHGIDSKLVRSSAWFIRRTREEEVQVYAGRVARELLRMGHGCLSRQTGAAAETQEDDSQPIYFVSASAEGSRAHFAEDTTINTASKFPVTRVVSIGPSNPQLIPEQIQNRVLAGHQAASQMHPTLGKPIHGFFAILLSC
jgi:hypothetical protein